MLKKLVVSLVCAMGIALLFAHSAKAAPHCPDVTPYSSDPQYGSCVMGTTMGICKIGNLNCNWSCTSDGHGGEHPTSVTCSFDFCNPHGGVYGGPGCCGPCSPSGT
jgi:hypothetical protein